MISSFFLSLIIFLLNGISVLRFYQIKDYLYKRVIAHFYLPSSKRIILNLKEYFLFLFVIFSFILTFFKEVRLNLKIDFLIFLFFLVLTLRFNFLRKIHFTPKVLIVVFLIFLINFLILYLFSNHLLIFAILNLWISQFIIFTFGFKIFNFLVKPYLFYLGKKVKAKINQNKKLKIIGLAGSYGKSGTKEILYQLLKIKYKVIAPLPRINHEYALLKFFNRVSLDNFDYALVEFGSYYLKNVEFITKYITPNIAFITGITKQHLHLFGNIENIIQGEGVEILTCMKEGILFVNNNHEYYEKLKKEIEKFKNIKIYTYGLNADFSYKIIEQNLEKTIFEFKSLNKTYIFETNIIFPMQIENLCGALAFISLIDDLENYREAIKNLELPEGFLKLKKIDKLYIFDDSYNANPRGVFASLDYFKKLNFDYKVIIFNGLFELGNETEQIYENLAKEFLNFDKIILTSSDYLQIFQKILKDKVLVIQKQSDLDLLLKTLNQKGSAIFIFNRFSSNLKINEEKIYQH